MDSYTKKGASDQRSGVNETNACFSSSSRKLCGTMFVSAGILFSEIVLLESAVYLQSVMIVPMIAPVECLLPW